MSLLASITSPRDLKRLSDAQMTELAAEIRRVPGRRGRQDRRAPRPEPRRRRAHARDAPGVRLAAGPVRVRHRAPVVRAQARHRAAGLLAPARAGRHRRVPAAQRVRARHRRVLARVVVAVLGGRHLAGVRADRPVGPHGRRRRRRRRAHRRHDLGSAQQHLRRQRSPARHRRQRQRPLVRPDDRRHGAVPELRPHPARVPRAVREDPRRGRPLRRTRACGVPGRCAAACTASCRGSPTTKRCTRTSTSSTSGRSTGTTSRRWKPRCARPRSTAPR